MDDSIRLKCAKFFVNMFVYNYVLSGPATVRMVSNNGPPLPMPMHVPPGHMVQQIVDENGILTHVILSPQPHNVMGSPMTVGFYVCIMGFPFALLLPYECDLLDLYIVTVW